MEFVGYVIIGIKTLSVNITESNGTLPVNFGESVQLNANTSGLVNSYVWTPSQYVVSLIKKWGKSYILMSVIESLI